MMIKENDNLSYYIIPDLSTWMNDAREQSKFERYSEIEDAICRFKELRNMEYNTSSKDDLARLTLGVSIYTLTGPKHFPFETDLLQVRCNTNYLCGDFLKFSEICSDPSFIKAVNKINEDIGYEKIKTYMPLTEEEIKKIGTERMELFPFLSKNFSLNMENQEHVLSNTEMQFLEKLASSVHDKNSEIHMDKQEYVTSILEEAKDVGYLKTVAKLKDAENSIISKEISRRNK